MPMKVLASVQRAPSFLTVASLLIANVRSLGEPWYLRWIQPAGHRGCEVGVVAVHTVEGAGDIILVFCLGGDAEAGAQNRAPKVVLPWVVESVENEVEDAKSCFHNTLRLGTSVKRESRSSWCQFSTFASRGLYRLQER